MNHLKKYENFSTDSFTNKLYNKWRSFIDSLIENFEEFEDSGWHWSSGSMKNRNKLISLDWWPEFNCIMLHSGDDYVPSKKDYDVDYTGHFEDGKLVWETKEFNYKQRSKEVIKVSEELKDFTVSVKRLNDITGVNFSFSYNNKGGELRIVIRGVVKIKFNHK
jgi:hypothetical protein